MDWRNALEGLEARLTDLSAHGVAYLSVPADPALEALLTRLPGVAASRPSPGKRLARGAQDLPFPVPLSGAAPLPARPGPVAPQEAPASPGAAAQEKATESPPVAAAAGSLESLHYQFRECTNCELGAARNCLVFGMGHHTPRLMFIGEGPGAEEDAQGLPFVGRAGRLLTGLIEAVGLAREDVYITNVVKCRPPGNRNPEMDEIAACRPILQRQMELLDPALIVVLGNVPLKTLNPRAGGITRERGNTFSYGPWKVLPTFHPSYLLRNASALEPCWNDFKTAVRLAFGEDP